MEDSKILDDVLGGVDEETCQDGIPLVVLVSSTVNFKEVSSDEREV